MNSPRGIVGKYQDQEVSAKKGLNLDKLLEKVLLGRCST